MRDIYPRARIKTCSSLLGLIQPAVFEGPAGYGSWVRAAIGAPTVSMLVMIVPMPSSARWTGRRTTLMSWGPVHRELPDALGVSGVAAAPS
jgi:hypothetical protein